MAIIGSFTANRTGFSGSLHTLTVSAKIAIRAVDKDSDKAPDYRIHSEDLEIGAAWRKTSREGRDYLSVKLDDPAFPAPVYATLVESDVDGQFSLIWSR